MATCTSRCRLVLLPHDAQLWQRIVPLMSSSTPRLAVPRQLRYAGGCVGVDDLCVRDRVVRLVLYSLC